MAVEQARIHIVPKPWGRTDLRPWNAYHDTRTAIGEVWFERSDASAPLPALLLKLIFTNEPLSIQVHPDDALARAIGLSHGKWEAWYILSASADASIAVGLKNRLTPARLRACICDGSIANRVQWRPVRTGETTCVPPGTIHAIGAGLVLVEIQQRSAATFRLFDYGRGRELHVDIAVAAANADQSEHATIARKLTAARTLLVGGPHFVLERLTLPPGCVRELDATGETWLFILAGHGQVGSIDIESPNAVFLEADRARISAGSDGLESLVAYVGSAPAPDLLRRLTGARVPDPARGRDRAPSRRAPLPVNRKPVAGAAP